MDEQTFDDIARAIGTGASRRKAVQTFGAGALAILVGWSIQEDAADAAQEIDAERKKRRKKRKQKLHLNAFGCVAVGGRCRGNSANCCSGICDGPKPKKGKKDKSCCVPHNTGGCQVEQDGCATGVPIDCGSAGFCVRTTGNAGFCGLQFLGVCTACQRDADCVALGLGDDAACVVCELACGTDNGGTRCIPAAA